jgi:hypothetical protein
VPARVEVGELVQTIEHVAHELLEEETCRASSRSRSAASGYAMKAMNVRP